MLAVDQPQASVYMDISLLIGYPGVMHQPLNKSLLQPLMVIIS